MTQDKFAGEWTKGFERLTGIATLAGLLVGGMAHAQTSAEGAGSTTSTSDTTQTTTGTGTTTGENAALKKTLQDMYDQCVTATKKRDETVLARLRATDYQYIDANKKTYTRAQVEENERRALAEAKTIDSVNSQVQDLKVESKDGKATTLGTGATVPVGTKVTATLHQTFAGTFADAKQKTHKITYNTDTRDVWQQTRNGWQLQSVQVIGRTATRDGKPFNPDATPGNSNRSTSNNGQRVRNTGYRAPRIASVGTTGLKLPKVPHPSTHSHKKHKAP